MTVRPRVCTVWLQAGELVVVDPSCSTSIQLARQFDVVWIDRRTIRMAAIEACRAVLDSAVAHLSPGGLLVGVFDQRATDLRRQFVQMCDQFPLERAAGIAIPVTSTDQSLVVVCNAGGTARRWQR